MKQRDFFRICLFILIFLLFNRGFSDWFVAWTRQSSDYQMAVQYMEQMQDQVSVIFLGDSHAQSSVMAGEINGAYNFSSAGESYIFTYYKIRYYLESGNFHPQVAILPIDLHSFSSFRGDRVETQDPAFWGKYLDYVDYGLETGTLMQMFPTVVESKIGIVGGLDGLYKHLCCSEPPNLEMSLAGYSPETGYFSSQPLEKQLEHAESRAKLHFKRSNYMDEIMVNYFYRLLDLLQSYDVQVVFVYYPITELYYREVNKYISVDSHLSTIEGVLADRQPALILDYHDLFFGHLEYFRNSDHLNIHGAEIFTQILIEDLTEAAVLPVRSVEN